MLKNWTVTTQAVKLAGDGIIIREHYLLSAKHPNHKHTEKLISIIGNTETSRRIALAGEKFRLHQQLNNTRGGRPLSSYAMEYCLTLPKGHRPTTEQWRSIVSDCCLALAQMLKLTTQEKSQYKTQVRAVLHQQKQTGNGGSGDHVHLIIGKAIEGRILKELQQKKATKLIKQAYNRAVLKHIGLDHKEFQPCELNKGKRLETWQYQYQKAQDTLEIQKLICLLQNQADKWFKAQEDNNLRQTHRQRNRISKTLSQLDNLSQSPQQRSQINSLKQRIK